MKGYHFFIVRFDAEDGASTIGDGNIWIPPVTVKGGTSGFYSIKVSK